MARCTAPVYGHRTASAAAACPACGSRYGGRNSHSSYFNPYSPLYTMPNNSTSRVSSGSIRRSKPSWSRSSSPSYYTIAEVQALTPIRLTIETLATNTDLRDVFLCHAWDDRNSHQFFL